MTSANYIGLHSFSRQPVMLTHSHQSARAAAAAPVA